MEIRKKENIQAKTETPSLIELFVDKVTRKIKWLDRNRKEKVIATEDYVTTAISNIPTPAVPNLQEVTDIGSETTNPIGILSASSSLTLDGAGIVALTVPGNVPTWSVDNGLGDANFRDINLRNITTDSVSNTNGLIKPYKSYVVKLVQPGDTSAPAVSEFENNLGAPVVWTRNNMGQYYGTLIGAFPASGFWKLVDISIQQVDSEEKADLARVSDDLVVLNVYDGTVTYVDGFEVDIEIRIYN